MDWTTNGGSSWLQCGPFTVGTTGTSKTSAAQTTGTSSSYKFRACGKASTGSRPLHHLVVTGLSTLSGAPHRERRTGHARCMSAGSLSTARQ